MSCFSKVVYYIINSFVTEGVEDAQVMIIRIFLLFECGFAVRTTRSIVWFSAVVSSHWTLSKHTTVISSGTVSMQRGFGHSTARIFDRDFPVEAESRGKRHTEVRVSDVRVLDESTWNKKLDTLNTNMTYRDWRSTLETSGLTDLKLSNNRLLATYRTHRLTASFWFYTVSGDHIIAPIWKQHMSNLQTLNWLFSVFFTSTISLFSSLSIYLPFFLSNFLSEEL